MAPAFEAESGIQDTTGVFHGYRGPKSAPLPEFQPPMCIAINRQTGARGRDVGERLSELLQFTLLTSETLEFAAEEKGRIGGDVPRLARPWIEARLEALSTMGNLSKHPDLQPILRTMLECAALGHCVLIGKGATFALPPDDTLRVRLVAPETDRIAFISQWDRMPLAEAEQYTRRRERNRARWLMEKFGIDQEQPEQYDLVLNTSQLGVDGCAELIATALKIKSCSRKSV